MVAYTTTKNIAQVANSSYVGTWDVPTNSNWGIVDAALGQITTISLNNSPVVLSTPQFQCAQITFNSTLTGNVAITFPSTFTGPYIIQNICTGSSAFVVTLKTTVAGGQVVGCPFGEIFDVYNDGTNLKFRNLGRVGSYWDYAGSSTPLWVTTCTVPPYLNCDGTAFSSAIYPVLATILGGTTLPDSKGRARSALNQGSNRLLSSNNGVNGNVLLSGGGGSVTLSSINIPNYTLPVTDPQHSHNFYITNNAAGNSPIGTGTHTTGSGTNIGPTDAAATGITVNSGGSGTPITLATPTYIGGITLIRAA